MNRTRGSDRAREEGGGWCFVTQRATSKFRLRRSVCLTTASGLLLTSAGTHPAPLSKQVVLMVLEEREGPHGELEGESGKGTIQGAITFNLPLNFLPS